jgi:hypothetical protein
MISYSTSFPGTPGFSGPLVFSPYYVGGENYQNPENPILDRSGEGFQGQVFPNPGNQKTEPRKPLQLRICDAIYVTRSA